MSDIAINPTGLLEHKVATRMMPYYLVVLEGHKKEQFFIATKLDTVGNYNKFVGFYTDGPVDNIVANYLDLISKAEPTVYFEILIPYNRVISIRSLTYRHKK